MLIARSAAAACILLVGSGCVVGHQQFLEYEAPLRYPPVKGTWVFEYSNVDVRQLKDAVFPELLTLASSSFNGPYETPAQSQGFAARMGADVFVVSTKYAETRTSAVPLTLPSSSTTNYSGYVGSQRVSGSATTYGTTTTMIPVTVHRYLQTGLYLRNVNGVRLLWQKTRGDFPETGESPFKGRWRNESYRLEVYRSGEWA